MLRELCCSPRIDADCEDIVFDKLAEWSKAPREKNFCGDSELLLHKRIWDVLNRDKEGLPEEHRFVAWCRRIAEHRTESTAANSAATEHADDDNSFQNLIKDILAHDFTAEQQEDPTYCLREGKSITSKQRGLAKVILRRFPDRFLHTRARHSYIAGSTFAETATRKNTFTWHAGRSYDMVRLLVAMACRIQRGTENNHGTRAVRS